MLRAARNNFFFLSVFSQGFARTMTGSPSLDGGVCSAVSLSAPPFPVQRSTRGMALLAEWPSMHLEGSLPEEVISGLDRELAEPVLGACLPRLQKKVA